MGNEIEPYQDPRLYEDIKDVPERFWQISKQGMYNVVNSHNGTARLAFAGTSYRAAGKTGTAQVFSLKGKDYNKNAITKNLHDHAWFVGYAPYDNPQVIVSVILENAGGGSTAAAPLARQTMDYYLNNLINHENSGLQNSESNSPLVEEKNE